MKRLPRRPSSFDLRCESCGRFPEPAKTRLTLANIAIMLPVELIVHALVVGTNLSYVAKVLVLAVTATALVIWVAEPSAMHLLRRWLHAPALRRRSRIHSAPALWRARTTVQDRPGALEELTRALAQRDINILALHVHAGAGSCVDEFVLSVPGPLGERDILDALAAGGGVQESVWPTTALALVDGQTKALSLAARVARQPTELPHAVAELLSARVAPGGQKQSGFEGAGDGTVLKIPTAWQGPLVFVRPGEPFTRAESARAHRLAELAEIVELSARR